ncbi:Acg family FMN-binding oxidoreductase [Mangrovihabitans endophyticus]|uniref:Nitroreductase family protein n=1 Tax=Mangrovihabitans endophyticus TaxID=1751298 RepID=A0A8J3C8L5_9ACTN|nr:nitroreductase [Mangrovihabitans endophyticus]GGL19278.1 hypothetical protein GCM10012284_62250 [Mangrovihabitans endophyticus]
MRHTDPAPAHTGYRADDLVTAVAAAIRAPSMHNTQPWRFRLRDGGIDVLLDPQRGLTVADPTGWAARIACGAATFNARLALAVAGRPARVRLRPGPEPELAARMTPGPPRPATYVEQDLAAAIAHRHSNRQPFWPDPVPSPMRVRLLEAARAEGAWLDLLVGTTAFAGVAEIARSADRVLRRDPAYVAELMTWAHSDAARDGVPTPSGVAAIPGGPVPHRPYGEGPHGHDREPEPLLAVLGMGGDTAADQVAAGQALQHVLLAAHDVGLAASMISQPIEVPGAREQLRQAVGRRGVPQMVLRLGYGVRGRPTPRRDPAEFIDD